MRVIKFRAWDKVNKQMIPHELLEIGVKNINKNPKKNQFHYMQYTGLKDGDEVEIYEGDEVEFRANYSSKLCGWMKGIVIFSESDLQWMLENINGKYSISEETDEFYYKSKVIGSIHDNN